MATDKVIEFGFPRDGRDRTHSRSAPLSILSVGRDPDILRLRNQVIRSRSEMNIRSMNPEEAESWARRTEPYLWIFCSTVELSKVVYLACSIRRYSSCSKLLLLEGSRAIGFEAQLFHQVLNPIQSVEEFLDAVSHLSLAA